MSLNRATIIGHLGEDSEMRYTSSGLPVGLFSCYRRGLPRQGRQRARIVWNRIVW